MASHVFPILTYHSLDKSGSVISTAPSIFKKQMESLHHQGYHTLTLSEVLDSIHLRKPFPEKTFAITFDDGYQNFYIEAFPVLQELRFKATVFVITDYCGKNNNWPNDCSPAGLQPLLSWSQIKEMHKYGIELGSHTLSHPDLTKIPAKEAEKEIRLSKENIQNILGENIKTFAYPYGRHNVQITKIVREYFTGACSTRLGKIGIDSDPCLLKRLDMYYLSRVTHLKALSSKAFELHMGFRQIFRDLRNYFI